MNDVTQDEAPIDELARDWEDYDEFMVKVPSRYQREEATLYRTKWFDYRFMHPAQATLVYARHYETIYRRTFKINIDRATSEYIRIIRDGSLLNPPRPAHEGASARVIAAASKAATAKLSFITGMWRGRQFADAMGMPYDIYIDGALHHRLRYWRQSYLPRPTQLYHENKGEDDMKQAYFVTAMEKWWNAKQQATLLYSRHDEYQVDQYVGTRDQNDHHEWLIGQIQLRQNPAPLLGRLMVEGFLPFEKIKTRFEPDVVNRVESTFKSL